MRDCTRAFLPRSIQGFRTLSYSRKFHRSWQTIYRPFRPRCFSLRRRIFQEDPNSYCSQTRNYAPISKTVSACAPSNILRSGSASEIYRDTRKARGWCGAPWAANCTSPREDRNDRWSAPSEREYLMPKPFKYPRSSTYGAEAGANRVMPLSGYAMPRIILPSFSSSVLRQDKISSITATGEQSPGALCSAPWTAISCGEFFKISCHFA